MIIPKVSSIEEGVEKVKSMGINGGSVMYCTFTDTPFWMTAEIIEQVIYET